MSNIEILFADYLMDFELFSSNSRFLVRYSTLIERSSGWDRANEGFD